MAFPLQYQLPMERLNKHRSLFFQFAVTTIVTLTFSVSFGGQHKLFKCAKYLIPLGNEHSVPSVSEKYTSAAIQDLRFFRTHRMKGLVDHPSSAEAIATSHSGKRARQAVNSRLTAIIEEGKTSMGIDEESGEGVRQILVGSSYVGSDNIAEHLAGRASLVKEIVIDNRAERARQGLLKYVGSPLINTALFFITSYPTVLTPLFLIPNRGEPETMIRSFTLHSHGKNEEKYFSKVLKNLHPDFWSYRSFDLPLPEELMKKIWRTRTLDMMDMMKHWDDHVAPRVTYKYTTDRAINIKHTPQKRSWVRIDELLYFDKGTGEPTLLVFARLTEKVPAYPKASKQSTKEKSEAYEGLAEPTR